MEMSRLRKNRGAKRKLQEVLDQDEDKRVQRTEGLSNHPKQSCPPSTSLLSLMDEVLFSLFSKLITTKRGKILRDPFGAIALAQSHPRLLRIFGRMITQVTTDICQGPPPFMLLPEQFFLDVLPFMGHSLRKLCLVHLGCGFIKNLAKFCPNLDVFSYSPRRCDCSRCMRTFSDVLALQIRSLTIFWPTPKCLSKIRIAPPDLSITRCDHRCFDELSRILRNPPNRLNIDVYFHSNSYHIRQDQAKILSILSHACPKLEGLTMTTDILSGLDNNSIEEFGERVVELISSARNNTIESKCQAISVEGDAATWLLRRVNPQAKIQIGCYRSGTISHTISDGFRFDKLYLMSKCPDMDFSSVPEVVITSVCNNSWKNALKDLKLKKAEVEDVSKANVLCLDVEVVEMDYSIVRPGAWGWLKRVREIHLTDYKNYLNLPDITDFVTALTQIVDIFDGDLYWFVETKKLRLRTEPRCPAGERKLRRDVRALDIAVDKFDDRTNSGDMIRAAVQRIKQHLRM